MRYTRFEQLILILGSVAIGGSAVAGIRGNPDLVEVLAQLLIVFVLVGAVHWGRKGGLLAAVAASLAYILMRIPLLMRVDTLSLDIFVMLLTRILTFGIVGVAGGELCSRIKYIFTRLESDSSIDDWTHIYNQRQASRILESVYAQHARYGTPFSVLVVCLADALTSELRPAKQRSVIRSVADHIRGDVRLVDDVGRLDDGRFIVVLPHTPREGGTVAGDRVRQGIRDLIGAKDESVVLDLMAAPEDLPRLQAFVESIRVPQTADQTSGE